MIVYQISLSSHYIAAYKKYVKDNKQRVKVLKKALLLLKENPKHPSLHTEKLQGSNMWTVRISKGERLFFIWYDENTILLVDLGAHDKYRAY